MKLDRFGYVLASKMLVDGKRKVRYMYHENPTGPEDSGWRFFCGDEDAEYVNDPSNIAIYDIHTVLKIDRSVIPYLSEKAVIAFERTKNRGPFAISKGFVPGAE